MKKIFTLFIFFISLVELFGQEEGRKTYLYLGNNTGFIGKIESVPEAGKISFSINNGGTRTYQKERVLVVFNDYGRYLVIASLPDSPESAQAIIDNFYNKPVPLPENDVIFKAVPFEVIPCIITYNGDAVNYRTLEGNPASINKDNVLAIVKKDGTHEITKEVSEVAPILDANIAKFKTSIEKPEVKPIQPSKPKPVKPEQKPETKPEQKVENKPVTVANEVKPLPVTDVSSKPKLTQDEKVKYSKQSVDNILTFKDYLNVIGDRGKSATEKREAIKAALELFSPGATVEVTNKNRPGSRKLPVETYLRNLSNLNYSSIQIEYANLKFVSEFSQADDGNYYGLVRGEQSFIGFGPDGKTPLYSDVVDKNYKVKLESFKKVESGISEVKWKILLGDVSVSQ